jgi:hypothetical protein
MTVMGPLFRHRFPLFTLPAFLALALFFAIRPEESRAGFITPLTLKPESARANGMGDAFEGVADDQSALFFNPAGLSRLTQARLALDQDSFSGLFGATTGLFAVPVQSMGVFAASVKFIPWPQLPIYDSTGNFNYYSDNNEVTATLGWGKDLGKDLSFGLSLRFTNQNLYQSNYGFFSGSAGLLWDMGDDWRLGIVGAGLGSSVDGQTLANTLRLGLSRLLRFSDGLTLLPAVSGMWGPDVNNDLKAGVEAGLNQGVFLRAGYQFPFYQNALGGLDGFTSGAGVRFSGFQMDVSFLTLGDFGQNYTAELSYDLPNQGPSAPVTVYATPVPKPQSTPAAVAPAKAKSSVRIHFELPAQGKDRRATAAGGPSPKEIQKYEAKVQKSPDDSQAWRDLGIIYYQAGRVDDANQCFEQALKLNPGDKKLKAWLQRSQTP